MIRRRGSTPASPPQSRAIPFRGTGVAVSLENKGTPETVQKIGEAKFSLVFCYFEITYQFT
jgi:hypothetical protein